MKLKVHLLLQIPVFIALQLLFGFPASLIGTLAHFIPSIDYVMMLAGVRVRLHRKLTHNIFVIAAASILIYLFFGPLAAGLGLLNLAFHVALDLNKSGITIFYPVSGYKLKWKRHGRNN
jgi:membrane-bound metal-dependent hydrolase YbcI (DUF457 family)